MRMKELEARLEEEVSNSQLKSQKERKGEYEDNISKLNEKRARKWLCQRGKSHTLAFSDDELRKLNECFLALDDDGSGAIGIDELEEPLIGLGFADTREEVLAMIMDVDDDGSGQIEFPEFLMIIKNSDASEKTARINKFFKDMSNGVLGSKDVSFNLIVQKFRRQYMIDAIMNPSGRIEDKLEGMRILTNVKKTIEYHKEHDDDEDD